MPMRMVLIIIACLSVGVAAVGASAPGTVAAPVAATQPGGATSQPALDLSTPKQALISFRRAIDSGNAQLAKQAAITNPSLDAGIDAWADAARSTNELASAAVARFGAGGEIASPFDFSGDSTRELAGAQEQIAGPMAVVIPPGQPPYHVRRLEGTWKVDLASSRFGQQLELYTPMMAGLAKAADVTTDEVRAGKYATAKDAQTALRQRLSEIMQAHAARLRPTSSRPATTQP